MHFSIPGFTELYGESTTGTTYTGYNIYINGTYHCCLRYKQLHALHEDLRRRCTNLNIQLPVFPPKRLLPLTNGQLETRRIALEHYMQLIGQDVRIAKLEYFQKFLLQAQLETALTEGALDDYEDEMSLQVDGVDGGGVGAASTSRPLELVLMNGYQLQVNCSISDNATLLLQKACKFIHLPTHMVPYFCLYLMRRDTKDSLIFLRRLSDFESPYLSRLQSRPCQIVLRKSYWNPVYDFKLMKDPVALNLLFIQTVSDVEREWIISTSDARRKLRCLHDHGMKKEYVEMARQLPSYGCMQFYATHVDYAEHEQNALVSIGNRELSLRTMKGDRIYETKFRVTRMRVWRVTSTHMARECKDVPSELILAFEYLMCKGNLRWINITSPQAMLMSACLQSMVDEYYSSSSGGSGGGGSSNSSATTTPQDDSGGKLFEESPKHPATITTTATKRITDGGCGGRYSQSTISSSSSTPSFSNEPTSTMSASTPTTITSNSSIANSPTLAQQTLNQQHPVQFLSQRYIKKQNSKISTNSYSGVFFRNADESAIQQQNEAFEGIGDDDL